jgi:adenosylcobyric acid synthase
MSKALMILGTASHVGKSVLTAAFCRILVNRGLRVAPFKAQNMALNSAATPEGLEIGRAQAMQAEACRIPASVDMNPILIKPSSDTGAQVVVAGRIWGTVTAADFHQRKVRELFPIVCESFARLAASRDVVVLEGAGSPAEINLRDGDLVNMRMAAAADAACVLVGDIDRGGVFASLVGTMALLNEEERARIRGFVINKFRGDEALLRPGIREIESRLGVPCVGVVPHLRDVGVDEEDSVALAERPMAARVWTQSATMERTLRVGVVALPRVANFTDFDPLMREPSVSLAYVVTPDEVHAADVLILPGTKQTLDDLTWLESRGLAHAIRARAARGGLTMGICGGMQMLGRRVSDPDGIEGGGDREGLGLLAIETTLARHKVTVRSRGTLCRAEIFGVPATVRDVTGYEIHVGITHILNGTHMLNDTQEPNGTHEKNDAAPFAILTREHGPAIADGAISADGRVLGTYLHGVFDDDEWRHAWLDAARAGCNLSPVTTHAFVTRDRDARYDRLAAAVERACDMDRILSWLTLSRVS